MQSTGGIMIGVLGACVALATLMASAAPQDSGKSLAERLGYKATDKLLIIHADDVGMCHSVNMATIRAMEKGVVSSASIMIPCPWMPEIAQYCREHPDADFGLHLTLTSEWKHYRWRTVAPYTEVPGIIDSEGFMHRSEEDTQKRATPAEIEKEIRAQILRAKQFGIKPTHVDSHMGTLFYKGFYEVYAKVAKEHGILPMLLFPTPDRIAMAKALGFDGAVEDYRRMSREGYVFLDILKEGAEGTTLEARRQHYYDKLRALKPGVTEFIVHLALNDEEIKSVTGNWEARYNEYLIMTDPKTRELIDSLGIKLIGYKDLAKLAYKP
jgi:chitin disaccharide deacetylase